MQLESVCSIPVEEFLLTRIAFTPDGHHILVGHRNPVLYGILSGRPVRTYPFEAFLGSVAFSPGGAYMALVNEDDHHPRTPGLARVFDTATGDLLHEVKTEFPVASCCFLESAEDALFLYRDAVPDESGGIRYRRNLVRGCRLPSGEQSLELDLPDWEIRGLACSRDGLSVFGLDSLARTRRIESASLDYRSFKAGIFSLPGGEVQRVCEIGIGVGLAQFSPTGRLLAAENVIFGENERRLSVLDGSRCSLQTLLTIQSDVVPSIAFSEDERYLLCLTENGSGAGAALRLWDTDRLALAGQTPFGPQYHALAIHNGTSRIAALGGGRCDIGLFQVESA